MGRIVTSLTVASYENLDQVIRMDALVDTGAQMLTLPMAWRDRFGVFGDVVDDVAVFADGRKAKALRAGPVQIKIEGFAPVFDEVLFVEMQATGSADGSAQSFEPLLGCIPLEKSRAAVDMLGHRLLKVEAFDLKGVRFS